MLKTKVKSFFTGLQVCVVALAAMDLEPRLFNKRFLRPVDPTIDTIHGFARTVNHVFDVFKLTCSGSYVTRPLVGKKRMLTDVGDV